MNARLFVALLLAPTLAACSVHVGLTGVSANDAKMAIKERIIPLIAAYDPKLKIGATSCPPVIEESDTPTAACTLLVDGVALPIMVDSSVPGTAQVALDGFMYERSHIEGYAVSTLADDYGFRSAVRCPGDVVVEMKAGTDFSCTFTGSTKAHSMHLRVMPSSQLFFYRIAGIRYNDPIPAGLLTAHKEGRPAVLPGPAAERMMRNDLKAESPEKAAGLTVSCPSTLDLTGKKSVICALAGPRGFVQHERFHIEPVEGLVYTPIDIAVDRQFIQKQAQADLNRRMADAGRPDQVVISCGSGFVTVPIGGTFDCAMRSGAKRYRLVVTIAKGGQASWVGVPVN